MRTCTLSSLYLSALVMLAAPSAHAAIPQLDPTWFASQLFWLAVSFVLMVVLVRTVIAPTLESVLATRKEAIESAVREAEHIRAEAVSADASMGGTIATAREKAAAQTLQAQQESARHNGECLLALEQELKIKLSRAEAAVADAKASAMNELQEHAANLTKTLVEKLLGASVNAADALNSTRKVS